jgi:hypothetical protein
MSTPKAVLAAVAFFAVVLGLAFHQSQDEQRDVITPQVAHAFNPDAPSMLNIGRVPLGTSEAQARRLLGVPDDVQTMNTQGYTTHCLYYPDGWQLCFDNGILAPHHPLKLTSKNHY